MFTDDMDEVTEWKEFEQWQVQARRPLPCVSEVDASSSLHAVGQADSLQRLTELC